MWIYLYELENITKSRREFVAMYLHMDMDVDCECVAVVVVVDDVVTHRERRRAGESNAGSCGSVYTCRYVRLCYVYTLYVVVAIHLISGSSVTSTLNLIQLVNGTCCCLLHTHSHTSFRSFDRFFLTLSHSFSHEFGSLVEKKNAFDKLLRISIASSKSRGDLNSVEISCMFLRVMNTTARAPQVICFLLVIAEFLFSFASCFRGSSKNTHTRQKLRRTKTESRQFDRNTKQNK